MTTMERELEQAYAGETVSLVRQRFAIVLPLYVVLMGGGIAFECLAYTNRSGPAIAYWVIECAVVAAAAVAYRAPRLERHTGVVGAGMTGILSVLIAHYNVVVGGEPLRSAMTLATLLNGLAVLLPWGPGVQAAGAGFALVGYATLYGLLGLDHSAASDSWGLSLMAVAVAGVTSVTGAHFLDRSRFEAFRRATLHAEEVDITATLLKVTETLSTHLGVPDVLDRVNQLARDATGCDWSSTFLVDESRGAYRLAANAGSSPAVREMLQQTEFSRDAIPLLQAFRAGTLVEIASPENQQLVPVSLLRRAENASALYAPIGRGEKIVGVLLVGYRTREGSFTTKQRRLTLGIAHALAVALENARLIGDLQAASRLKSDFVATMSHELRTPLNIIMGYSEMLAEDVYTPGTDAWRQTLVRIQRASVELMDLITATLDMGRLEAGRESVALGPLRVDGLLVEIAGEVEPLVPTGVRFVAESDVGDQPITTDGPKVKTVLKNLVGNALKFTTEGTVELRARADGDLFVLTVRDTGVGIAPEYLPVIFDMFRQVDGSTTRRYGGVGLGLHIVKRLTTLMGGRVDVVSTVGRGSTFTVTLPITAARQRATGT